MEDAYKLEGIVLDDMDMIDAMDTEIGGASKVLPIKYVKKNGTYSGSSRWIFVQPGRIRGAFCTGGSPGGSDLPGNLRWKDRHQTKERKEKRYGR